MSTSKPRTPKIIGLLGGMSWPSTIAYYSRLNQLIQEKLGENHSCRILLYSIDYNPIKSYNYTQWDQIANLLKQELQVLEKAAPDCILIGNNTLHKAYNLLTPHWQPQQPVLHAVELTIAAAKRSGYSKLLLLGTKFTMNDDYFRGALLANGFEVIVPTNTEQQAIQSIQSRVAQNTIKEEFFSYFTNLCATYQHAEAIVLACTELPLVVRPATVLQPILNPVELQCQRAVEFYLSVDG